MNTHDRKRCCKCKLNKPVGDFYVGRGANRKEELVSICKSCCGEYKKSKRPIWNKNRRFKYKNDIEYKSKINYKVNSENAKLKLDVFSNYCGGKDDIQCQCPCGCLVFDINFLTIQHLNNDGKEHRQIIGKGRILRWLKTHNFPKGFAVFCFNCNCGSAINGGICPNLVKELINDAAILKYQYV